MTLAALRISLHVSSSAYLCVNNQHTLPALRIYMYIHTHSQQTYIHTCRVPFAISQWVLVHYIYSVEIHTQYGLWGYVSADMQHSFPCKGSITVPVETLHMRGVLQSQLDQIRWTCLWRRVHKQDLVRVDLTCHRSLQINHILPTQELQWLQHL